MAARRGKSQARRNSNQGTPGWVWLVAGVAIAAVVFLAAPNLFKNDGDGFLRVGPQPDPNAQPAPVSDADTDVGTELPKPGAAKPAEPAKPAATQYDFYTLLPESEVIVPPEAVPEKTPPVPAQPVTPVTPAEAAKIDTARAQAALLGQTPPPPPPVIKPAATTQYFLQAGSFRKQADADKVRAQIILLGQSVKVESGTVKDETWYRVLVGPFSNREQLTGAQKQLAGAGFSNLLLQQRQTRQ